MEVEGAPRVRVDPPLVGQEGPGAEDVVVDNSDSWRDAQQRKAALEELGILVDDEDEDDDKDSPEYSYHPLHYHPPPQHQGLPLPFDDDDVLDQEGDGDEVDVTTLVSEKERRWNRHEEEMAELRSAHTIAVAKLEAKESELAQLTQLLVTLRCVHSPTLLFFIPRCTRKYHHCSSAVDWPTALCAFYLACIACAGSAFREWV
jgi:hypothetical protein